MKIKVAMVIILIMVLICGCVNNIQDTKDIQTTETNQTEEISSEFKGDSTGINTSIEESIESLVDEENGVQAIENMQDLFEYIIVGQMKFYNYSQNEIDPFGDYLYEENYTSEGVGCVDDFYMWDGKADNFYEIIHNDLQDMYGAYKYREVDKSIIREDKFRSYEFEYIIFPPEFNGNNKVFKYKGVMYIALVERRDPITYHINIKGHLFVTLLVPIVSDELMVYIGHIEGPDTSSEEVMILVGDTVEWRNMEGMKNPRYLISEDGLWDEPIRLNFAQTHEYTFNETGTYTFSLKYNEFNSKQKIVVIYIKY